MKNAQAWRFYESHSQKSSAQRCMDISVKRCVYLPLTLAFNPMLSPTPNPLPCHLGILCKKLSRVEIQR